MWSFFYWFFDLCYTTFTMRRILALDVWRLTGDFPFTIWLDAWRLTGVGATFRPNWSLTCDCIHNSAWRVKVGAWRVSSQLQKNLKFSSSHANIWFAFSRQPRQNEEWTFFYHLKEKVNFFIGYFIKYHCLYPSHANFSHITYNFYEEFEYFTEKWWSKRIFLSWN